jgi:hypothetical protein
MNQAELAKVIAKTAAEVCQRAALGDEAKTLLRDGMTPRQLLEALMAGQLHADAARFLAHALPKREAVWWACLCAERVLGPEPPASARAALSAAKAWVIDPKDENRRAALPAAEAADLGTPAGCAAVAAYFSGGSLTPPELTPVPPGEHLTGNMVAASLALATVAKEPEKAPEKYAEFLKLGFEVANGQHAWPEAPKPQPQPPSRGPAHGDARRPRR